MEFTDLNDQVRNAEYFFVVSHEGDDYVETKVIGRNDRNWIEWYQLDVFREKNPMIMLMKKPEKMGD